MSRKPNLPGAVGTLILAATFALAVAPSRAADAAVDPVSTGSLPVTGDLELPEMSDADRLATILDRFDQAQLDIATLQAEFAESKQLAVLVDTLESSGRFYYASPDRAKWEYVQPENRIFVINDDAVLQYFPEEKTLEKKDLQAALTHRLFKVFGVGQTSTELKNYYDIELGHDEGASQAVGDDTYLLVLTPHSRRVSKRLSRVLLWVGDDDFLPQAMEYQEVDGDITHLAFSNVRINESLEPATFELEVPDDVEVRNGISFFENTAGGSR